eukprot:TRINITY_DN7470_c2_g1_i2.p1 TRINITY_DN7470_c2_g1~~TRINITY_DN7470_c2_g1_i2.p1  ORF type:complete len:391 (+),score=81.82 TRINITY_DN7470_c2_g1_i2:129-1301(+)
MSKNGKAQKGRVKSWNLAKGFGFVVDGAGNEAFVHTSDLDGGVLVEGEPVSYEPTPSQTKPGVILAVNIRGAGVKRKSVQPPQEDGVVKSWDYARGSGLILGDNNDDIFVHASVFGGGTLVQGKHVKYEAVDIHHHSGRRVALQVVGDAVRPVGEHKGIVKKWFPSRGFGFIETPDGKEVYVHCSNISDGHLKEGMTAYFNIRKGSMKRGEIADSDRRDERYLASDISGPAVRPGYPPGYAPPAGTKGAPAPTGPPAFTHPAPRGGYGPPSSGSRGRGGKSGLPTPHYGGGGYDEYEDHGPSYSHYTPQYPTSSSDSYRADPYGHDYNAYHADSYGRDYDAYASHAPSKGKGQYKSGKGGHGKRGGGPPYDYPGTVGYKGDGSGGHKGRR